MKKLIELNTVIENILNPEIKFIQNVDNYLFNDIWVNEIGNEFFDKKLETIVNLLESNIDLDKINDVKYLKQIHQEVLEVHESIQKINFEDLSYFNDNSKIKNIHINYPEKLENQPKLKCSEINTSFEYLNFDDTLEIILNIMKNYYQIEEFDFYGHDVDTSSKQSQLNDYIIEKYKLSEYDLERGYATSFLSLALLSHRKLIANILNYIGNLIRVINKIQSCDETIDYNKSLIIDNPNDIKLELAMKKQDIAIFFHTLHNVGIIKTDTNDVYDSQNKLKSFINNANLYYTFNKQLTKVDRINKEFTPLNNKEINDKEIEFIENIISKFNARVQEIKNRES